MVKFLGHTLRRLCFSGAIFLSLASLSLAVCAAGIAPGQDYPSKPIRLVLANAPGGSPDIPARWIAQNLTEVLGKPVVLDNRGGAGGKIAYEIVAKAAPDGYTLLFVTNAFLLSSFGANNTFDTVKDFAPITRVATAPTLLLARSTLGFHSVKDLIAFAKKNPGKLTYASIGVGSTPHLYGEMLKVMAGIDMLHVPYKGSAPAMVDMIAGRMDLQFVGIASALPFLKNGQVVALGVANKERSQFLPDVPSLDEQGVTGFDGGTREGISAPAHTPPAVIAKIHDALAKVLATPETKKAFADAGLEPTVSTPAEFDAWIKDQIAQYGKIIKATGIQLQQ